MKLDSQLIQSLAWALVHSLWQAGIVFATCMVVSKAIGRDASRRYALMVGSLAILPVLFVGTLLYLLDRPTVAVAAAFPNDVTISSSQIVGTVTAGFLGWINSLLSWIDLQLSWIIKIWFVGSVLSMFRVVGGMMYLRSLRINALPVSLSWEEKVNGLANCLDIARRISIAEAKVSTPMVIGYLKPVILFPIGMLAGLAPSQIDAIMLHEIAHIRRHDFVVNLFQCVMESIFFFNPFIWLLSAQIRMLREHCCDDVVISRGVSPLAYVKALAIVEEAAVKGTLALALTGDRNQLLGRMRRIMEKSIVKKEWGGMRLLPLWFALVGLVCASWLSIGSEKPALKSLKDKVKSDTSIVEKEGEKLKRIDSYRSETDHEDEAMPEDILQHGPAIADMLKGFAFEGLDAPAIAFGPWPGDSIPGFGYVPTEEWAVFEKEFTEKFREEFKEFFEKNRPQFEKMMEELRKQHHNFEGWSLDGDELLRDQLRAMEEFRYINPPIPNPGNFTAPGVFVMPFPDSGALLQGHAEQLDLLERAIEDMSHNEDLLHSQEGLMALDEMLLRRNEAALDEYEQAMIKQLISDGYLSQDEGIKNLKIHDDEITINGKKVQEKDLKKYKEIMEKYQPVWSTPRRPE